MNSIEFVFCLFVVTEFQFSDAQHWSYHHEDEWATAFPICGSETQSPIDFFPDLIVHNTTIPEFQFHNYDAVLNFTEFSLINNGHTIQMNIIDNSTGSVRETPFIISGGGLPSNFTLTQFHFHWGLLNDEGSEHTVQHASYPMELHLVHWDYINHNSFGVASNRSDGLAVLGIFVQIGEENNTAFEYLISYFSNITYQDEVASQVSQFPLDDLLPSNRKDFYRYRGSLTTPPCYNSVIWTVFLQPITISEYQLRQFRTRLYEEAINETPRTFLVDNFRVTQPVHARTVYKTFDKVDWSYGENNGPDEWKYFFPKCNGDFQSPIDIPTASAVTNNAIPALNFTNYESIPSGTTLELVNSGTSVDLMVRGSTGPKISGGNLVGDYILEKITLRWGSNNGLGSEHTVNSLSYPLEMQFLHYSSKYSNSLEASSHVNGLAMLSVLYQANPENNSNLTNIWMQLPYVRIPGNTSVVNSFSLMTLIPSAEDRSFYRYQGSLTIPNCAETVTWIVFTEPLTVSQKQMEVIRNSVSSTANGTIPLTNNFRPTRPLGSRTIWKSVHKAEARLVTCAAPPSSIISLWMLFSAALCLASRV